MNECNSVKQTKKKEEFCIETKEGWEQVTGIQEISRSHAKPHTDRDITTAIQK